MKKAKPQPNSANRKIRYAVVGLGHIAQVAVLPAFKHARHNSELVALVSDDPKKLKELAKKYHVAHTYSYEQYEDCLTHDHVDAVYIALPNSLHCEYTIRAAERGVHILCEKPLAVTEAECELMINAVERHQVKLMTAYRLHFEEANLKCIKLLQSGKLGDARAFQSLFTMQVKSDDIRLRKDLGGGTLYDIGIYCINAARYLFRDEPEEVFAFSIRGTQQRFQEVDEMTSAVLRFPQERLATFTTSFGAADIGWYQVAGAKGSLRLAGAYDYAEKRELELMIGKRTQKHKFPVRDQFAAELIYFSDCLLNDKQPEPSGREGLADVRIIRALYRSAEIGRPVKLGKMEVNRRPSPRQEINRPKVKEPEQIHVSSPHRD